MIETFDEVLLVYTMPPSVGMGLGPLPSWPGVSGETSRSMRSLD